MNIEAQLPFRLEKLFDLSMQMTSITASRIPEELFDGLGTEDVATEVWSVFQQHLQDLMDLTAAADWDDFTDSTPVTPQQVQFYLMSNYGQDLFDDADFKQLWEQYLMSPTSLTGTSAGVFYDAGALLGAWNALKGKRG